MDHGGPINLPFKDMVYAHKNGDDLGMAYGMGFTKLSTILYLTNFDKIPHPSPSCVQGLSGLVGQLLKEQATLIGTGATISLTFQLDVVSGQRITRGNKSPSSCACHSTCSPCHCQRVG